MLYRGTLMINLNDFLRFRFYNEQSMIKHTICSGVELYCYYEVSDEFSSVVFNDHSNVKCCKDGVWVFNKAFESIKVNFKWVLDKIRILEYK